MQAKSLHKLRNSRISTNQNEPDITASAAASSTVPAASNNQGVISDLVPLMPPDEPSESYVDTDVQKPQGPISAPASSDLLSKASKDLRPLVELANTKNLEKYGYCHRDSMYNRASSTKNKGIRINALFLMTIAFVIIKMSEVYYSSISLECRQHSSTACQTPKSHTNRVSVGQGNKRIHYSEHDSQPILPLHFNYSR